MQAKASSSLTQPWTADRENGALLVGGAGHGAGPRTRARRRPVFELTPREVIERCRRNHHCLTCAGQVLALRTCMEWRGWSISELAEHSGVSRSHLSEILTVQTTASTDILDALAVSFGFEHFEFDLLVAFCLRAEVSG